MKIQIACEVKINYNNIAQSLGFIADNFSKPKPIIIDNRLIKVLNKTSYQRKYTGIDINYSFYKSNTTEIKYKKKEPYVRNNILQKYTFNSSTYSFYQVYIANVLVKDHIDKFEFNRNSNAIYLNFSNSDIKQKITEIAVKQNIKRILDLKDKTINCKLTNTSNPLNVSEIYTFSSESLVFKQYGQSSVIVKSYIFSSKPTECQFDSNGNLSSITLPIRLGKYETIFEINDPNITIRRIYRLPYGLQYDDKKIYGRLVLNKEFDLIMILSNGQRLQIKLKPIMTEIYQI